MAAVTEYERSLLRLFRQRLNDLELPEQLSPDHELVRWIRARENDLDAAEKMLRESLKWRKDNDVDNILSWKPPAEYDRLYPYHVGITRDNGVFIIVTTGRIDYKTMVANEENKRLFLKYVTRMWEEVASLMKGRKNSEGVPVTQASVIFDLECISLSSVMSFSILGVTKDGALQFDRNQPERLRSAMLINSSRVISILLSFFKSFLPAKTFGKIGSIDSDPTKCREYLLGLISEEELPMLYGGKQANSMLNQFL